MKVTNELKNVFNEMYDQYGFTDKIGTLYFKEHEAYLRKISYISLLEYHMDEFPHQYVLDFLMSTSFLWGDDNTIWAEMLLSYDRSKIKGSISMSSHFIDVEFLCRYVGVDAIGYIYNSKKIYSKNRDNILSYFYNNPYPLLQSDLDNEDLDGVYFVEKNVLTGLFNDLMSNYGFMEMKFIMKIIMNL